MGLILGIFYYRFFQTHISTDDAYVTGPIYFLSFRVSGAVAKVMVHDNQLVEEGRVQSLIAGTGSAFSLFPPENGTGNYVKIVQRLPVKIILDKGQENLPQLRVGMSVVPTILIEN